MTSRPALPPLAALPLLGLSLLGLPILGFTAAGLPLLSRAAWAADPPAAIQPSTPQSSAPTPPAPTPPAPTSPAIIAGEAKEAATALARELGTEQMLMQMMNIMRGQLEQAIATRNPAADARKVVDEIIMPEFQRGAGAMTDRVADIWASHFDVEELKQLRAFYETPVGRKAVQAMPEIARESQAVGATWGRTTMMEIISKRGADLKAMGVDLSK